MDSSPGDTDQKKPPLSSFESVKQMEKDNNRAVTPVQPFVPPPDDDERDLENNNHQDKESEMDIETMKNGDIKAEPIKLSDSVIKGKENAPSKVERSTSAISNQGRYLATVSINNDLVLYEISTGSEICKVLDKSHSVTSIAFLGEDKNLVTGATDNKVKVWEVMSDSQNKDRKNLEERDDIDFKVPVLQVCPHPNFSMIGVLLKGNVVKLRHLATKDKDEADIKVKDCNITKLLISENHIIYGADSGNIYVWNYEDMNPDDPVFMLSKHQKPVCHLSSREDLLASLDRDNDLLCLWSLEKKKLQHKISLDGSEILALCLSDDQNLVFLSTAEKQVSNCLLLFKVRVQMPVEGALYINQGIIEKP